MSLDRPDSELLYLLKRRRERTSRYDFGLFALRDDLLAARLSAPTVHLLAQRVREQGRAQWVNEPGPGVARTVYEDGCFLQYEVLHKNERRDFLSALEKE